MTETNESAKQNPVSVFVETVSALFSRDDLESFRKCEGAFQELIDSNFEADLFNAELRSLLKDPAFRGDWRPMQLRIVSGRVFNLSISLIDASRRYIHSTPFNAMFSPIGTEPLEYDQYSLPRGFSDDVFDPSLRLTYVSSGCVNPREIKFFDGSRFAYDFKINKPVLTVMFYTASFATLEWLFSKENLHAWQANDAEIGSTQLRVACNILGRLAHQSSLDPLLQMVKHPHHSVRWAAIQNIGRLNREEAIKALQEASRDPHPHVRAAARKSLQRLSDV